MANPSLQSPVIPPTQASLNKILVEKTRSECEIPSYSVLEVLGPQYENWKQDPLILPPDSIVVFKFHLQNLGLPLPPFFLLFSCDS